MPDGVRELVFNKPIRCANPNCARTIPPGRAWQFSNGRYVCELCPVAYMDELMLEDESLTPDDIQFDPVEITYSKLSRCRRGI